MRQQQDEPGRFSICSRQAAVVQEIRASVHRTHSMSGYKTPLLNDFCGEPLKRRVRDYYSSPAIEIEEFETAYKGSPEEKHEFTSYY
ncbi:hypothetical protein [Klebsiella pneumoniae]|uniref:hypothetical protein n=1 Tax=Klebsiella pneumoniae TaxID=573 RepID=UPI000D725209|nr:hypothetical protein [Klebsiella pneumoniae]